MQANRGMAMVPRNGVRKKRRTRSKQKQYAIIARNPACGTRDDAAERFGTG
jgi:hypothetical protein